jgi:hypothetical protein
MAPKRHESPWHKLTAQLDDGELDYTVGHPDDCQLRRSGPICWFAGEFFEDKEDVPTEPGIYRARVWMEKTWAGDWDSGSEWEPLPGGEVA